MEILLPLAIHDHKGDVFAVDNDMISFLLEKRKQSIKPLKLNEIDASSIKKWYRCFLRAHWYKGKWPHLWFHSRDLYVHH